MGPQWVGHPDHHQPKVPRHDSVLQQRQVPHCLEVDQGRRWQLRSSSKETTRRFEDHTKDVLSVAFSADNRQIVSASRDKTIKLWNTLARCKYTIQEDGHQDWVSCVRFSPNNQNPIIVSAGWDKYVKVWNLTNCKLKTNHIGHTGYLNTVTMSPDGSLCASGGKDGKAMLWDL